MAADFDLRALYAALDGERAARSLSWAELARELGVSASALRGFGVRSSAEGDGVLRAVAWLGRSPESFVPGGAAGEGTPLPAGAPAGLRFDARALYAELDGHGWRRGCRGQRSRRRAAQGAPRP